jgi:cysteine sulfinate desulfinase/cysteine desulfurase-like protein
MYHARNIIAPATSSTRGAGFIRHIEGKALVPSFVAFSPDGTALAGSGSNCTRFMKHKSAAIRKLSVKEHLATSVVLITLGLVSPSAQISRLRTRLVSTKAHRACRLRRMA